MCFLMGAAGDGWAFVATDTSYQLRDDNGIVVEGLEGRRRVEPVGGKVVYDGAAFTGFAGSVSHYFDALDHHVESGRWVEPTRGPTDRVSRFLQARVVDGRPEVLDTRTNGHRETVRGGFTLSPPTMSDDGVQKLTALIRERSKECGTLVVEWIKLAAAAIDLSADLSKTCTREIEVGLVLRPGLNTGGAWHMRAPAAGIGTVPELALERVGPGHASATRSAVYKEYRRLDAERQLAHAELNDVLIRGELDAATGTFEGDLTAATTNAQNINTTGTVTVGDTLFCVSLETTGSGAGSYTKIASAELGFYNATPVSKQTISSARDDPEGALADLLSALDALGLITDASTES